MNYVLTKLLTDEGGASFYIIGIFSDKKIAAEKAAEIYKDYNKNASFQNIEMVTEWLAAKREYSFRPDKNHRLQLAITEVAEIDTALADNKQLIYRSAAAEDEMLRKISQALIDGRHSAGSLPNEGSCPIEKK